MYQHQPKISSKILSYSPNYTPPTMCLQTCTMKHPSTTATSSNLHTMDTPPSPEMQNLLPLGVQYSQLYDLHRYSINRSSGILRSHMILSALQIMLHECQHEKSTLQPKANSPLLQQNELRRKINMTSDKKAIFEAFIQQLKIIINNELQEKKANSPQHQQILQQQIQQ